MGIKFNPFTGNFDFVNDSDFATRTQNITASGQSITIGPQLRQKINLTTTGIWDLSTVAFTSSTAIKDGTEITVVFKSSSGQVTFKPGSGAGDYSGSDIYMSNLGQIASFTYDSTANLWFCKALSA